MCLACGNFGVPPFLPCVARHVPVSHCVPAPRLSSAVRRRIGMQTSTPYAGRGIPLPPRPPFAFSLAFPLASPQKGEYLPIRAEIAYKIPKLIYPFRSVFWYNRSVSAFSLQAPPTARAVKTPSGAFHDRQSPIRTFCFQTDGREDFVPSPSPVRQSGPGGSAEQARKHHHKRKEVRA